MQQSCLKAALRYARRGWRVFPLLGKRPPFKAWQDEATTNPRRIKRWWQQWPDANVAIICDSQRGPIVLDIDGPSGAQLVDELQLPETREARSSTKHKRHLYFEPATSGVSIPRIIKVRANDQKYDLDILGDGGYVVAPPSLHPGTGKHYKWISRVHMVPFPTEALHLVIQSTNGKSYATADPLPTVLDEGERDKLLTSLAGSMRRRNADEATILAALREMNATRVNPPLEDKQLRKIARSIATKPPAGQGENLTDLGNARRLVMQHRDDVRSTPGVKRRVWHIWDGTRWSPDETGEIDRKAKSTIRSLYTEAEHTSDTDLRESLLKHATRSERASSVRSMLELAITEPEFAVTSAVLDANPWHFNVENGTIDLQTGVLHPHRRDDLITKLAPVVFDPKATAPLWHTFLKSIFPTRELRAFVQRAVGYSLTGDTREQCFFFCYGQGANGKTTFFETIKRLLGDYAQQADFTTFLARRSEGPRNDIARMRGARIVAAVEAQGDREFDLAVLKQLTGGDTVTARRLYEEATEFRPQHKIFLAANHKPIIREQTEATWRRIRLIPFEVKIPKKQQIDRLGEKIVASELSGILRWALAGTRNWLADGLGIPKDVRRATRDYKEENDILGEFIVRRCELGKLRWAAGSDLYRAFANWWVDTRGPRSTPISAPWFARLLSERSELSPRKVDKVRGWDGIALRLEMDT